MGLNIKNPETERLIRELAEKTGKGQTEAVTIAVREALERRQQLGLADRLMEIGRETAPLLRGLNWDEAMYGEDGLYDRKTGLPK